MTDNHIANLHHATFESIRQHDVVGNEYWSARKLAKVLEYSEYRHFQPVIERAREACQVSGYGVADHFEVVLDMVDIGSGAKRALPDVRLSRYACYLIVQNGDPSKPVIANGQTYFAMQTRKAEQIERRLLEAERVAARKKLTSTEKELSEVIYEQTGSDQNFAVIRSKGDQALFGKNTQTMKSQWKVPDNRPPARNKLGKRRTSLFCRSRKSGNPVNSIKLDSRFRGNDDLIGVSLGRK